LTDSNSLFFFPIALPYNIAQICLRCLADEGAADEWNCVGRLAGKVNRLLEQRDWLGQ
jgi:hypothetical protein